ncbi:MAG: hypothetical protein ABI151_17000, partial [Chitinophagaceae bacterium]
GKQSWIFPDGIHEISFKELKIFSSSQKMELDSFTLKQKATPGRPGVVLTGDKFFFNSSHLPTIYQKNELNIDTLYCVNPILSILGKGNNDEANKSDRQKKVDTTAQSANALFKLIRINYIDVSNGEFHLKQNDLDTSVSGAHKTNARIYNLVIDNENDKELSTDSIKINLKNLQFYSSDSLSKLKIADFILQGKDAVFRNVEYLPSEFNHYKRGITFTAPQLLLKDINLNELMRHRFKARSASLIKPSIVAYNKNKADAPVIHAIPQKGEEEMSLFFRSLHRIKSLLDVEKFGIEKGKVGYAIEGLKPLKVDANNLNATFLLNKLFVSDSMVDIKHSIPNFQMGDLNLAAKNMHIKVSNYRFDGINRRNWGDRLMVSLNNGTLLTGKDIYWEVFDWDIYTKTKEIQIDLLRIGDLNINAAAKQDGISKKAGTPKDLPVLRLAKLDVNKIQFNSSSLKNSLHLVGGDFHAENIGTATHFFTWTKASANLSDISSTGEGYKASIKNIAFNAAGETTIRKVAFESKNEKGQTTLEMPFIKLKTELYSTDFSKLSLQSLVSDSAIAIIYSKPVDQKGNAKPLKLPAFVLEKIKFNHLSIDYTKISSKDTMALKTVLNINVKDLRTFKDTEKLAAYKQVDLDAKSVKLVEKNIQADLPFSVHLENGMVHRNEQNKISFASAIQFATKDAAFQYRKDSIALSAKKLELAFHDSEFKIGGGHKLLWEKLIDKASFTGEDFFYKGKKVTVAAEGYSLSETADKLNFKNFSLTPNLTRDESFASAKWQNDYIVVKGKSISINNFKYNHSKTDSSLLIGTIVADGLDLNTSRDKTIPFQHGIEKLMPTKLIAKIGLPIKIDSVVLINSNVTYHEFSVGTKKWSALPLTHLNGSISNITNQFKLHDSLKLSVSTDLFDNHIRQFVYAESYSDSLSGFSARQAMSPVTLSQFSKFSKPLAGVSITSGIADTVFADWTGNKYAAFGTMNFHYRDLKLKLYNKQDTSKRGFVPKVETVIANLILPSKKRKSSLIYFVRDREKFIFNYWIKAQVSGILSTMGIKKDKKYRKQYKKNSRQYSLPKLG